MTPIEFIDHNKIEQCKETIRRIWNYKKVDHIPISVCFDDFSNYTLREQCENGELQVDVQIGNINRCLRALPDDYIPNIRIWPGYITLGTMFGLPVHWSDDPNQAPGLAGHPVTDMSMVYDLPMPDPMSDGLMPHNLRWLRYCTEHLPKDVYLTGIDLGGPMNTAKDLLDTNLLYTAFYDNSAALHHLLGKVTELQIRCYDAIIEAVRDINRFTSFDFDPLWAPEGRKGFVSDDVCASFSPEMFREFSMPYNNRIYQKFGGGRLHNCGPNPSIDLYMDHEPEIGALNCSFRYSRCDLARIKEAFRGKGVVEFNFDFGETFDEIVNGYEEIANALAPDVVALPLLFLDHTWSDSALTDLYMTLRGVSERYAREIAWSKE